jgi:hypothetical protein
LFVRHSDSRGVEVQAALPHPLRADQARFTSFHEDDAKNHTASSGWTLGGRVGDLAQIMVNFVPAAFCQPTYISSGLSRDFRYSSHAA